MVSKQITQHLIVEKRVQVQPKLDHLLCLVEKYIAFISPIPPHLKGKVKVYYLENPLAVIVPDLYGISEFQVSMENAILLQLDDSSDETSQTQF